MAPGTWMTILAACLLSGRVVLPDLAPPGGLTVVLARTGDRIATTDVSGAFGFSLPDSLGPSTILEFWQGDRLLSSHPFFCDRPQTVVLPAEGFSMAPVRVTAPPLELAWEGDARRVETLAPDEVLAATAGLPSVAEAIQQFPGVGAVGRDGFTSAPTIRGLGRDRSLVLLEGIRLSADRGVGPSASFLDPYLLGDVQIVRGTSGVAYGSGAMGGVVLLDLPSPGARPEYMAQASGSSNGGGSAGAIFVARPIGSGWRAALGSALRRQGDYRFPDGERLEGGTAINSGLRSGGGTLTLARASGSRLLRIAVIGTTANDVGRPTTQALREDTIADEDHVIASARLTDETEAGRSEWTLGMHRPRTVNRADRVNDVGRVTRTTFTDNASMDATGVGRVERRRGAGTWLAGVDVFTRWNVDAVETRVDNADAEPPVETRVDLVENAKRADVGAYAGWKRPVRDVGEVLVTGRLDWARRSAMRRREASWVAPSLDVRVLYPLNAGWAVSAGVGRAFRAPRIQELYFAGDRPGGSRLANPDLQPETAWSGEGGVLWGRGAFSAAVTAWGMAVADFIAQLPVDAGGDTLRFENVTRGRLFGAEASFAWKRADEGASFEAAYATLHGEDDDGAPLPDIPSSEIRLAGALRLAGAAAAPRVRATASLRLGAAKTPAASGEAAAWWSDLLGATRIGGDEVGHRGYARADVGLSVWPTTDVRLQALVTNVLDARYLDRPEADAFPQPGRAVVIQLTVGG
jgi:outer membrane receptor protein involved in Fe transport